ncbi:MAG: hypothetical protein ACRDZ4_15950 [Egibacteraceae bacterium]
MSRMLAVVCAVLTEAQELKAPKAIRDAEARLVAAPDDATANLIVGKHLALVLGEWEKALPLLAKGSDKTLAEAASKELAKGPNALHKVEIGDLWALAAKKNRKERQPLLDRASRWYCDAWPDLDGFWKAKFRERAPSLYAPVGPARANASVLDQWGGAQKELPKVELAATYVHSGAAAVRITPATTGRLYLTLTLQPLVVKPGQTVEWSAWVLTDGTDSAADKMYCDVKDADGAHLFVKEPSIQPDMPVWRKMSVTTKLPDKAARVGMIICVQSTKGTLWIDDASVKVDGEERVKAPGFE